MIGLDTNILVRFVAQDDPLNDPIANAIIASLSPEEPGWVSLTAVAELIWVLDRTFKMGRPVAYAILNQLLGMPELLIEQSDVVRKAADLFSNGKADFTDYLILCSGQAAGCSCTLTFDKKASKADGMMLARDWLNTSP